MAILSGNPSSVHHPPGRRAPVIAKAGFTLLEVATVLTVIGVLAAIAVPRYAGFIAGQRADAAARRTTTDLAMAQRRARVTSRSQTISFNVALDEYAMPGVPDPDNAGVDYVVQLADEPYLALITSADFGGSPDLIIDGYGVPQSSGTIVICVGDYQRTLTVDPGESTPGGGGFKKSTVVR